MYFSKTYKTCWNFFKLVVYCCILLFESYSHDPYRQLTNIISLAHKIIWEEIWSKKSKNACWKNQRKR